MSIGASPVRTMSYNSIYLGSIYTLYIQYTHTFTYNDAHTYVHMYSHVQSICMYSVNVHTLSHIVHIHLRIHIQMRTCTLSIRTYVHTTYSAIVCKRHTCVYYLDICMYICIIQKHIGCTYFCIRSCMYSTRLTYALYHNIM